MDGFDTDKKEKLKMAVARLRKVLNWTICDNIVSLAENYGPEPDDLELPLALNAEDIGWTMWALGYIEGLCLQRKCTVSELFAAEGIDP